MALPFVTVLSGLVYNELRSRRLLKNLLYPFVVIIIFSSFIGLWGHSFAPVHLYDPSIDFLKIGENISPSPIDDYVKNQIAFDDYDFLWTDDVGSILLLLPNDQFEKIRKVPISRAENSTRS